MIILNLISLHSLQFCSHSDLTRTLLGAWLVVINNHVNNIKELDGVFLAKNSNNYYMEHSV